MTGDDDLDCGDVALFVGEELTLAVANPLSGPFEDATVEGLDTGEVTITTKTGQRFRMVVHELTGEEE